MHDLHAVIDVDEHRGLVEVPVVRRIAAPAGERARALVDGIFDVALDDIELIRKGERPHIDLAQRFGTLPQPAGERDDAVHERLRDLLDDVNALDGGTDLARIREGARHRTAGGPLQIGVLAEDHRVLARELERARNQPLRAGLCDGATGARGARKGDHVATGLDEGSSGGRIPGHDLEHALGDLGRAKDLLQGETHEGSDLRRLENDRVPRHQRLHGGSHGEKQREVPGCDRSNDTHGTVGADELHTLERVSPLSPAPQQPPGMSRVERERFAGARDLACQHLDARLAGVAADDLDQGADTSDQSIAHPEHEPTALPEAERGPAFLRRARSRDGLLHAGRRRDRYLPVLLERGGVEHLELASTVKLARPVDRL